MLRGRSLDKEPETRVWRMKFAPMFCGLCTVSAVARCADECQTSTYTITRSAQLASRASLDTTDEEGEDPAEATADLHLLDTLLLCSERFRGRSTLLLRVAVCGTVARSCSEMSVRLIAKSGMHCVVMS